MTIVSANFSFLAKHDEQLFRHAALAERYFPDDPNTSLIKVRQFAELLAQIVAASTARFESQEEKFVDLLRRLSLDRAVPRQVVDLFHQLRKSGNAAAHDGADDHRQALAALKIARQLGIWFHRTYRNEPQFKPGPFIPPSPPEDATAALREEIERLREELAASQSEAERAQRAADEEAERRESAEEKAKRETAERVEWEELAIEADRHREELKQLLEAQQVESEALPSMELVARMDAGEEAAEAIDLDEADTRVLIDQQIRDRGWEVDTNELRFSKGIRPAKGRNMAIAEWPTASGPADYALFVGTRCFGIVEAKRKRKNVSAAIDQSERYSKGIKLEDGAEAVGGPWGEYVVPFVFAANGRPYLKQLATQSGIWFRDARKATNHRRAMNDWPTPDGLLGRLEVDRDAAHAELNAQPIEFGFPLRPYQKEAIGAVEEALEHDQREILVAMATGTGKTKLSIALLYRLLAAKRFRRICFVVDRSALGSQAAGEFSTTKVVSGKTFAEIFGLKGLEDVVPDLETRVHICTIQGLVKRVLYQQEPGDIPPIDQYDLMVVDECHRGYLIDREMADQDLGFRNEADYISKYRRVLEHFDAVKIGLTATPALHTVEIFGEPVFRYSYREAVVDGFLIDHEPPVRITTALAEAGIVFKKGEQVELLDTKTGEIDLAHASDEISFEVEEFNRKVITVPFNQVVARELARHIDPAFPGKTLIFAATDGHADIVVEQLKKAFADEYGEIEDAAVRKITGSVDRAADLIRSFRNDANPKIAVTVDLLTTGVDVPRITNVVFLRRVKSRILYEQMLGRATRLCPEIGKETFRIFDAVDLYAHLQELTDMRPVVVDPTISLEQLFEELARAKEAEHKNNIREQIIVRMARKVRRLPDDVKHSYEAKAGETPEATLERLRNCSGIEAASWAATKSGIGPILDWRSGEKTPIAIPISRRDDELVDVSRGYGDAEKPEDYLDSFAAFVRDNVNKIAALNIVVRRPRDLTRAQLRELRLELDRQGFPEATLRRAWHDAKNEDIAASVVGFIRQAALGDPLVPYPERVRTAMDRILRSQSWSDPQRQWLQRIGEQLLQEVVVDKDALNRAPFDTHGGFNRLNKIFGGQLETVLSDINEELWGDVG
ncbi:MAG: type I restriction-modification system endonuclease [Rhodospirillaceae bacterium]|nr:type I restriction-modification system endonuclease [Rhodospirillaceae bacterium]